jgi:hypothetical protein
MKFSVFFGIFTLLLSAITVFGVPIEPGLPNLTPTGNPTTATPGVITQTSPSDDDVIPFYITAPVSGVTYTKGEATTIGKEIILHKLH